MPDDVSLLLFNLLYYTDRQSDDLPPVLKALLKSEQHQPLSTCTKAGEVAKTGSSCSNRTEIPRETERETDCNRDGGDRETVKTGTGPRSEKTKEGTAAGSSCDAAAADDDVDGDNPSRPVNRSDSEHDEQRRHDDVTAGINHVTSDVTGRRMMPNTQRHDDLMSETATTERHLSSSLYTGEGVEWRSGNPEYLPVIAVGLNNRRFLGEIAQQLDQRILRHVFTPRRIQHLSTYHLQDSTATVRCGSRDLYGFMVKDMARLIHQDCTSYGDTAGTEVTVDTARRYQLIYRYSYVRHSLAPFGYDFHFHPHFTARLVNRYGHLLPVYQHHRCRATPLHETSYRFLSTLGPDSRDQLSGVVRAVAPPGELDHCLVLLDCLVLLASDDGLPLFV